MLYPGLLHPEPCPCGRSLLTRTSTGDKHSKADLAQSLWGLLVCTRFCLSPPSISGRYGFDSKGNFDFKGNFVNQQTQELFKAEGTRSLA